MFLVPLLQVSPPPLHGPQDTNSPSFASISLTTPEYFLSISSPNWAAPLGSVLCVTCFFSDNFVLGKFRHSLSEYLLCAQSMSGNKLGTAGTAVNETKALFFISLGFYWAEEQSSNNQAKPLICHRAGAHKDYEEKRGRATSWNDREMVLL